MSSSDRASISSPRLQEKVPQRHRAGNEHEVNEQRGVGHDENEPGDVEPRLGRHINTQW